MLTNEIVYNCLRLQNLFDFVFRFFRVVDIKIRQNRFFGAVGRGDIQSHANRAGVRFEDRF